MIELEYAIDVCATKFTRGHRICITAHEDSGYIDLKRLDRVCQLQVGLERARMGTILLAIQNSQVAPKLIAKKPVHKHPLDRVPLQ